MHHEKILDKLDGLADFPWSFKASKDLDRVFDKYGNCLIWLATDKEHDKRHGEFIAAAPALIEKLLEEIDLLKLDEALRSELKLTLSDTKRKKLVNQILSVNFPEIQCFRCSKYFDSTWCQ